MSRSTPRTATAWAIALTIAGVRQAIFFTGGSVAAETMAAFDVAAGHP